MRPVSSFDANRYLFFFFFFQAEDGIRDIGVTGVQTCALPISRAHELGLRTAGKQESMDVCFITSGGRSTFLGSRIERRPGTIVDGAGAVVRSEERRVGKECRSRWSPYH